jgi:hypothetical protein
MNMDCKAFEELLETLLERSASAQERRAADEHLSGCARCRELDALVRDAGLTAPDDLTVDLTENILARTSGAACTRAQDLLCAKVDEDLAGIERELLDGHCVHCADCRALEAALIRLQEDLPSMAHADPGPGFTREVLAATLPLERKLARVARRARQVFERLAQRPRFAWEAGYVGALVLFLAFGLPGSPLRAMPGDALALAQVNPVEVVQNSSLARVPPVVASWSRNAWDATGARMLRSGASLSADMHVRFRRAASASGGFLLHGTQLEEAILDGNLEKALSVLKDMGSDLVRVWNRLVADVDEDAAPERNVETELG